MHLLAFVAACPEYLPLYTCCPLSLHPEHRLLGVTISPLFIFSKFMDPPPFASLAPFIDYFYIIRLHLFGSANLDVIESIIFSSRLSSFTYITFLLSKESQNTV